jgi:hypothetical protein
VAGRYRRRRGRTRAAAGVAVLDGVQGVEEGERSRFPSSGELAGVHGGGGAG